MRDRKDDDRTRPDRPFFETVNEPGRKGVLIDVEYDKMVEAKRIGEGLGDIAVQFFNIFGRRR